MLSVQGTDTAIPHELDPVTLEGTGIPERLPVCWGSNQVATVL